MWVIKYNILKIHHFYAIILVKLIFISTNYKFIKLQIKIKNIISGKYSDKFAKGANNIIQLILINI